MTALFKWFRIFVYTIFIESRRVHMKIPRNLRDSGGLMMVTFLLVKSLRRCTLHPPVR